MNDASVEARLKRLEDVQEIQVLKARYLRACDRKQPDLVRQCFIADATIDYEGFPPFADADAFVAIFAKWGCRPNIVDMHHLQNPIVEITGADSARGWFDLYFHQIDTDTGRHTQLAVAYDDAFVRVEGAWLIAKTVARRMSVVIGDVGADALTRIQFAGRTDTIAPADAGKDAA